MFYTHHNPKLKILLVLKQSKEIRVQNHGCVFPLQKSSNVWYTFGKTSKEIIMHQPLESKSFNSPIKHTHLVKGKNLHQNTI